MGTVNPIFLKLKMWQTNIKDIKKNFRFITTLAFC